MLQTSKRRQAMGEAHRVLGASVGPRASIRHLPPTHVRNSRRLTSIVALTQAADIHALTVTEIPMWEDLQNPPSASTPVFLEAEEYHSFVLAASDPGERMIHRRVTTPTTEDTQILGILGRGGATTTFDVGFGPVADPLRREEQLGNLPRTSELVLPNDEAPYGIDPFLEVGIAPATASHSSPQSVFISYAASRPLDLFVEAPHPVLETDVPSILLGYFAGTAQETVQDHIREHAIRPSTTLIHLAEAHPNPIPSETLAALERIKGLPDNWDGDGASRIDEKTVEKAEQLIREAFLAAPQGLKSPSVAPGFGGMIVAEWSGPKGRELILDIHAGDETPGFLLVERSPDGEEIETDEELSPPWYIPNLISRLVSD